MKSLGNKTRKRSGLQQQEAVLSGAHGTGTIRNSRRDLLPPGFTLTDGRYIKPEKKEDKLEKPVTKKGWETITFKERREGRRKSEISLLGRSISCKVEQAMTLTTDELLEHVYQTLASYVAGIDDPRYMNDTQSDRIREIIFETDMFLYRSGIDPDAQYQHHLRCMELLDETEEFRFILWDLEFQKCAAEQANRINKKLFGQENPPEDLSATEWIQLIQNAWSNAPTPADKTEVFAALYQIILFCDSVPVDNAIKASLYMRSCKRFGNIIERTKGSTDPEVLLQAVTDELTDYHFGHLRNVIAGKGNLSVPQIVIGYELKKMMGPNLAVAICHPDLQDLTMDTIVQRVLAHIHEPDEQDRLETRTKVEELIRDGLFTKVDFSEVVSLEEIIEAIRVPMQKVADEIKEEVEEAEKQYRGYYPVGAKVHFNEAVPEEKLQRLFEALGFKQSLFRMIHADTCMLIPPRKSGLEVVAMLNELKRRGIINERSDIQSCIPGRLNNQFAGILGSSMLLSSYQCLTYDRSAFETSHNHQTASMIMAYDAGILDRSIAELPEDITGRIDMLGRKDMRDVVLYQILGSFISQATYGGPFQKIGREFVEEYVLLLKQAGMLDILEAQWINDAESGVKPDIEGHYQVVKRCTDTWLADNEHFQKTGRQEGLSFNVLRLLTKKLQESRIIQTNLGLVEETTAEISLLLSNPDHV
jgi:hypothetical protein